MFSSTFVKSIVGALIAFVTVCIAPPSLAQSGQAFPSRPIKLVVSFAAGGSSDILARVLAQQFSMLTGATMIVENKPGASGAIAMEAVSRAASDGYTLLWGSDSTVVQPLLRKDFPVDPLKDLTPLARIGTAPTVISVHKSVPANSIKELVALAKAKPGALSYGSGGHGSTHNLAGEEFKVRSGVHIVHIPYKGTAPALQDALGGNIGVVLTGVVEVHKLAADPSSQIRVLAVMGKDRVANLPGVPTMIESGYPDFISGSWFGVLGPVGVPPAAADYLTKNIIAAAQTPEFRQRSSALALEISPLNGPDTAEFMKALSARFKDTIIKTGFKID